jgi:hypothetical protein
MCSAAANTAEAGGTTGASGSETAGMAARSDAWSMMETSESGRGRTGPTLSLDRTGSNQSRPLSHFNAG